MLHLVAVQPWITLADYASGAAFERKLDALGARVTAARARTGIPADDCLVVFPELMASFLALAGEDTRGIATVEAALARAARRHARDVVRAALRFRTVSPARAVLLALGPRVRRLYLQAYGRFARMHRAYVVAGSALLPDIDAGAPDDALPQRGGVYNTSYLFGPDGAVLAVTRKVNLVPDLEDTLGIDRGSAREVPVVPTAFGPLSTLICYDGFSEPHTDREPLWRPVAPRVARAGARVLCQPAANPWPWDGPWVHNARGESLVRRDQWRSEGLAGQLGTLAGVRYAVTAHLLGNILDARFEGRSEILARDADGGTRVLAAARGYGPDAASEEVLCAAVARP